MANGVALNAILDDIKRKALSEKQKGELFDSLVISYLSNEPYYREKFTKIWTYSDWENLLNRRHNEIDARKKAIGIDLVAEIDGSRQEFCAIQSHFNDENYCLQMSDISDFIEASARPEFTQRFIVSTGKIGQNVIQALAGLTPPCNIIGVDALSASRLDWNQHDFSAKTIPLRARKIPRLYQEEAIEKTVNCFKENERGKLIMACGSGKSLISLKIAEKIAGSGGFVLVLVPGLALLSQTITEWTQESTIALNCFAVCSDSDVGIIKINRADDFSLLRNELQYPATTDAEQLFEAVKNGFDNNRMTVIFSTYQSIDVISIAQKRGLPEFSFVVCDEAHRTTGAREREIGEEDESAFVRIHNNDFVRAQKRLYMTATPKIYKIKETPGNGADMVVSYSMDNISQYGPVFHGLSFTDAVNNNILVDYKVIVVSVDESIVNRKIKLLGEGDNALVASDAAKIVGCFKALANRGAADSFCGVNASPLKRAVAFCQTIEPVSSRKNGAPRAHKVSSKLVAEMFSKTIGDYLSDSEEDEWLKNIKCEVKHVDGAMSAIDKNEKLNWLREETPENVCRILTNVRCLALGVDIAALDAIIFLSPRESMIEIVQSVGRVMRQYPGKELGYVILPVVIPAGVDKRSALDDNKTYKAVWDTLQALRSHDNSFDNWINKLQFLKDKSGKIEFIAVTDYQERKGQDNADNSGADYSKGTRRDALEPKESNSFAIDSDYSFQMAFVSKLVKKIGNQDYLGQWADDVVRIANTYIDRIKAILEDSKNTSEIQIFNAFADELRGDLNNSLTNDDVIEMLAQHMIAGPAFASVFANNNFINLNPVSVSINRLLETLAPRHLEKEAVSLEGFYDSVRQEVEGAQNKVNGIDNFIGKQKIIVELYDKFFRRAFPKMTQRLGIVYTPIEIVDFIIHSVNELLFQEFGKTLGNRNVRVIDPFVGAGTFITRLLQSGIIDPRDLPFKYHHDISANEIILLAYYIATINIESVYHELVGQDYSPFPGIRLTDTFKSYDNNASVRRGFDDNSVKINDGNNRAPLVIIGNPPYSIGQKSENDDNKNIRYPCLDASIAATYVKESNAKNSKGLYDSYIRSFRWASDILENNDGIIGFVTNSGFIDKPAMDGLRKSFVNEFQKIYVINLRGDIRKNMLNGSEAKEGENIFGRASMTGIAITFLVKNSNSEREGKINYCDIGDSLSRSMKLEKLKTSKTLSIFKENNEFIAISPNNKHDWVNRRDNNFANYIAIGDKLSNNQIRLFDNYSLGVVTNRDAWCYNSSSNALKDNINKTINFYNKERTRFHELYFNIRNKEKKKVVDKFVEYDEKNISWSRGLKGDIRNNIELSFNENNLARALYRPFTKNWLYFDRRLNEMTYQMPLIFPSREAGNQVICVSGIGTRNGVSALISDIIPDLNLLEAGAQCFPLFLYNPEYFEEGSLFRDNNLDTQFKRYFAINNMGLKWFQDYYTQLAISKQDLFHYIYGIFHSLDYRERFGDNLSRELPRIPRVKKAKAFLRFVAAGRELASLHLNFETAEKYPLKIIAKETITEDDYRVQQMKFGKIGKEKDFSTIIYNSKITLKGIPLEARQYVVSGKPALNWVMKYQSVRTDKASGIVNDANIWASETMRNPRYPLELIQRVITVSLETLRIVNNLPPLEID
ncbi:MAG: DEAD/DEAH box helicase family protein [Deltaproteobacteria bacterium]|jgi:predicted helicase|nr:DEAD/DEAH box helicase family protein [Deltaproteobacteria bacterium]